MFSQLLSNLIHPYALAGISCTVLSCVTAPKSPKVAANSAVESPSSQASSRNSLHPLKKINSKKGAARLPTDTARINAPIGSIPSQRSLSCTHIFSRLLPSYRRLASKRSPVAGPPNASAQSLDRLLALTTEDCQTQPAAALRQVAAVIHQHSKRIGVLLPLTGKQSASARFILNGMRAQFREVGVNFEAQVVVFDTHGDSAVAERLLADLVLRERISLVIGGTQDNEARLLANYATGLMLPTILLTSQQTSTPIQPLNDKTSVSPYVFYAFPDQKQLAESLALAALKAQHRRLIILKPSDGHSDKIIDYFTDAAKKAGASSIKNVLYVPGNYDSMQNAGRQLFNIDTSARAEEYRQAYDQAKRAAAASDQPFNPRMVALKPIVDFDAIFIPDDFRTVRYFAKLFRYYGVDRLPLWGHHEWRSVGLIEPYDDFLENSIFADFIGSYAQLPPAIRAPTSTSIFFVPPDQVSLVDFQLIGYRTGQLASIALKNPPQYRRQIVKLLLQSQKFSVTHQSQWPTYLFQITKNGLTFERAAYSN